MTTIARFDTADFLATLYYAHKLIRLRKWYPSWFGYPCTTDIVIFRLLNRYRYLPLDFIQAHTGLSYSYVKTRLDVLARKPNKFLNRPDKQRAQPNVNYRYLIYELAFRGETVLKDHLLYSKEPRLGDEHMFAHSYPKP